MLYIPHEQVYFCKNAVMRLMRIRISEPKRIIVAYLTCFIGIILVHVLIREGSTSEARELCLDKNRNMNIELS